MASNRLLSRLRSASKFSTRVFTSRSAARAVALFDKQFQNFLRMTHCLARSVDESAALSCSVPDLQKEIFLFIRFMARSQRAGFSGPNLMPTVPERIQEASSRCVLHHSAFEAKASSSAVKAYKARPQFVFTVRGESPVSDALVPVYRMHQPTLVSPCVLGEPCYTCAVHAYCLSDPCKGCLQGKTVVCERAYPALPAFLVRIRSAIQLVRNGEAVFIHQNNALQLTFAKLTYLRDTSCNINGTAIWEYVAGSDRVRAALYVGWRKRVATITSIDGETATAFEIETEDDLPADAVENQQMYSASFEA
jgi:hypothetical protein